MFNLFLQNKEISWYFCYRWAQNKWKGCITFIRKACFPSSVTPTSAHCFWKRCFLSTSVSSLKAGVLIPVIAPSAIVFLFHMHTKEDLKQYAQKFSDAEIGFSCLSVPTPPALPKLNEVFFHGAEFMQPSNRCLRAAHLFRCSLPVILTSTWMRAWGRAGRVNRRPQLPLPLQTHTWALAEPYLAQ